MVGTSSVGKVVDGVLAAVDGVVTNCDRVVLAAIRDFFHHHPVNDGTALGPVGVGRSGVTVGPALGSAELLAFNFRGTYIRAIVS